MRRKPLSDKLLVAKDSANEQRRVYLIPGPCSRETAVAAQGRRRQNTPKIELPIGAAWTVWYKVNVGYLRPAAPTPRWIRAIVVMFSVLLGYLVVEAGYRVHAYYSIRNALLATTRGQIPANREDDPLSHVLHSNSVLDVDTGYRYRPNIEVQSSDPFPVAWKTNSHGHIARSEYPVAKPRDRFRIGLVPRPNRGDPSTCHGSAVVI